MIGVFQSVEAPAPVRAKASSWRKTNEFKKENILKERGREEGRRERERKSKWRVQSGDQTTPKKKQQLWLFPFKQK